MDLKNHTERLYSSLKILRKIGQGKCAKIVIKFFKIVFVCTLLHNIPKNN